MVDVEPGGLADEHDVVRAGADRELDAALRGGPRLPAAGGGEREAAGLSGGPSRVITDKAIFDFDPESKRMRLVSIHPGIAQEDVLANMSFRPIVPDRIPTTELPTAEQIRLIREEIDPHGMYAG